ncbi:major facilitator superfamily transporter sugar [Grosmannia clavigera kw1407]|uniref:Major facilitator superfamily transporter sugar n=1 Tax=Grosmannia clavigera (strain kw1407 / UAMH 11150) TaxID=655863 RepID=F0XA84_GROCL|nr:major facilitator superfamily transporter sugar [Grosmannia clavigera kw1407]EFX05800.1 major facilitator superfamily transporter sugar [Grosmannia clavigera kw1407]
MTPKSFAVPTYVKMCILTSLIGFLFGYDTGSIGPVTTMAEFKAVMGDFSDTIRGVVVSSSLITGAASASIAGILADRYGRIRISALGACIDGVGVAIECASPVLGVFILGRLIKGIGAGLYLSTIYVQVSEMSPARYRGVLTSIPQFIIVIGLIAGYFVCYGTSNIKDSSLAWRLPLAIASFAAFVLAVAVCFVPPSPRWFLTKGELEKARVVVQRLGFGQAEQDELLAQQQDEMPADAVEPSLATSIVHMFRDFREAFRQPYRSRTIFGCLIMAMQQFSGIDGVLYYAPLLFQNAGLKSTEASFLASGVSGLVIFAITIPATLLADHWGRRTASILGGVLVSVLMLLMGSLYAADQVHGAGRWVVIVCIYLFAISFNGTWGIVFRIYLVESLPRKTRSSASSLAQSANWVANYIVALVTPVLLSASTSGAYFFFGGMTVICTVIVTLYMVETRGATLEAIEQAYTDRMASKALKRKAEKTTIETNSAEASSFELGRTEKKEFTTVSETFVESE